MILLVKSSPFKSTHFAFYVSKYARYPINDGVKMFFQLINVFVFAMLAHIVANITFAYPIKSAFQKFLPVGATSYIGTPFLNVCILAIAKFLFGFSYEWSGIHRVEQFLIIERNTSNIDGFKPLFYLTFRSFTFVDKQFCLQDLSLFVFSHSTKVLWVSIFI